MWLAKYSDNSEKERAIRDVTLARVIGYALEQEYSGHRFRIDHEADQGVVMITHPLAPKHARYVIKLRDLYSDPSLKMVKRAGGELLDRAFQPRGRFREADFEDEKRKNHRAINGQLMERNWVTGETRYVLPDNWQR